MRTILHIDFDSFFASVEQQNNSAFRNRPVGVTAANSRTCIIAASKEAKLFGIETGTRSFEAYKKCPFLLLTPAHFHTYYEIHKKFLAICQRYSPYIEVFSIDELFMDITKTTVLFGTVDTIIAKIKADIAKEIGIYITVSVGVSHNKLLAKLASGLDKPDGVSYISTQDIERIYKMVALTDMCGIGKRISQRLEMLGVRNPFDLRRLTKEQLIAEFGQHEAEFLQDVAWARDKTEVISFGKAPTVKSIGRNYCLPRNEYNQRIILQHICALSEEIGKKLRKLNKKARGIGLSLTGTTHKHGVKTTNIYMDSGSDIYRLCVDLYHMWQWHIFPSDGMVRQISVWSFHITDKNTTPLSLFDQNRKQEKIATTVDTINEKFGNNTIYNGFLLRALKLETVPNGFLADRVNRMELTSLYATTP